jgi:hypothetical protein
MDHAVDFLLRLFSFSNKLLQVGIDGILSFQKRNDKVLLEWKSGFDRFFACPVFSMSLALNEYLG